MRSPSTLLLFAITAFTLYYSPLPVHSATTLANDNLTSSKGPERLKQIILTMGSWRKADVEQVTGILQKFTEQNPHIVIKFDPTSAADYNDVIEAQLENDTAPDLFYLRSFSHSKKLFNRGFLATLNDISDIKKNFPKEILKAWSTDDGTLYGVPLMAVSHGIYYNTTIFTELNIQVPQTWEQLLTVAKQLHNKGFIPFANATGDAWTINGLVLQNVIPNIIGGQKGRMEYYRGERCFNDEQMIAAFQAITDISPYVSKNQHLLKYADSLQLFLQGKSPMWFGGSWDIPFFQEQQPDFDWDIFPVPPPEGKNLHITFHPDAGIGLNKSSPHPKEARQFLQWMTTSEFASLLVHHLPGFYPMHQSSPPTTNKHAATFLDFNQKYPTDSRFVWGEIRDGEPSAYEISVKSSTEVMNGTITAKQAANRLQNGLSQWYKPATRCNN